MKQLGIDGFGDATAEALAELGASDREIEIYKVLLSAPGVSPRELGVQTGQSRGRIYETLRDMARRGLVREEPSHPTRFVAVPPKELVAVALSGTDRRRNLLALASKAFGPSLSGDANAGPPARAARYSLVRGRAATMRELADLVELAVDQVDIVGTDRILARIARPPACGPSAEGSTW
ncbi:MAG: hypothetical protein HYT80_01380 [Euryarchaeota archaeon]|nr:hypothetical protein [Euryarchaeota archaeon]